MNNTDAKKILKQFGKNAYKKRIAYVNSYMPKKAGALGKFSWKHGLRKGIPVAVAFVAIAVTWAVCAFGVEVFGKISSAWLIGIAVFLAFGVYTLLCNLTGGDLFQKMTMNIDKNYEEEVPMFYEIKYIPSGYKFLVKAPVGDDELNYIFKNEEGRYLRIDENVKDSFLLDMDFDNIEVKNIDIGNTAVSFYEYGNIKNYLFQHYNTYFRISGVIDEMELEKIIEKL